MPDAPVPLVSLQLVEFVGGPLDDQTHLVPLDDPHAEPGRIDVVVDQTGIRVCGYEWAERHSGGSLGHGGALVYRFCGYRDP